MFHGSVAAHTDKDREKGFKDGRSYKPRHSLYHREHARQSRSSSILDWAHECLPTPKSPLAYMQGTILM